MTEDRGNPLPTGSIPVVGYSKMTTNEVDKMNEMKEFINASAWLFRCPDDGRHCGHYRIICTSAT